MAPTAKSCGKSDREKGIRKVITGLTVLTTPAVRNPCASLLHYRLKYVYGLGKAEVLTVARETQAAFGLELAVSHSPARYNGKPVVHSSIKKLQLDVQHIYSPIRGGVVRLKFLNSLYSR